VIIHPSWLAKMAGVFLVKAKSTQRNKSDARYVALFEKKNAVHVWRDSILFPPEHHEAFFELLSIFELVYWMEGVSKYFVPSLLSDIDSGVKPIKDPNSITKKRSLRFSWLFPIGLFHRLIINVIRFYCSGKDVFSDYLPWRSGILLVWNYGTISLEEAELELHITCSGTSLSWIDKKMSEVIDIATSMISLNFPGTFKILIKIIGSKLIHLVHCPCEQIQPNRIHTWPLTKEDQLGFESSIYTMLEKDQSLACALKQLRLDHILIEREIKNAREIGVLISKQNRMDELRKYKGIILCLLF
jgi:hypothetical protein